MIGDIDTDYDEDYKALVKAVIENSIVDYIKLQHPLNRKKKYLEQTFINSVAMFFDDEYEFEAFTSFEDGSNLSTKEMIIIMTNTHSVSMDKTKDHIINESMSYWWEKNFHDFSIPSKVTICGKVWFLHNSTKNSYIDYENYKIYLPLKQKGNDRLYMEMVLKIILNHVGLDISEEHFLKLHKFLYLFLKVNNAFTTR